MGAAHPNEAGETHPRLQRRCQAFIKTSKPSAKQDGLKVRRTCLLVAIVPVLDLRVFGSRARGDATVVVTRDELEHGAPGASPLVLNVEREGVRP